MSNVIQEIDKLCIRLPINFLKLDVSGWKLLHYAAFKKVLTPVKLLKQTPFVIRNNRRQLEHIADQQNLYSAEWLMISVSKIF